MADAVACLMKYCYLCSKKSKGYLKKIWFPTPPSHSNRIFILVSSDLIWAQPKSLLHSSAQSLHPISPIWPTSLLVELPVDIMELFIWSPPLRNKQSFQCNNAYFSYWSCISMPFDERNIFSRPIDNIFKIDWDMNLDLNEFGSALQNCCLAHDLLVKDSFEPHSGILRKTPLNWIQIFLTLIWPVQVPVPSINIPLWTIGCVSGFS